MAVGRKVNIDRLDLGKANVDHDRAVKVDASLRSTSNRKVYAVGDAAGGLQFTHVAGYHAGVVIRSALFGLPSKQRTDHIPWVTYTDPELAQVGLTEAEAPQKLASAGGCALSHTTRMTGHCRRQNHRSHQGDGAQRPPCRGLNRWRSRRGIDRRLGAGHRQQDEVCPP